jgi:hypothetical protein
MARVTSIVLKLDNGMYRTIDLERVGTIYLKDKPAKAQVLDGEDWVSAESPVPEWDWKGETLRGETPPSDDDDDGQFCYYVNGVLVCQP